MLRMKWEGGRDIVGEKQGESILGQGMIVGGSSRRGRICLRADL